MIKKGLLSILIFLLLVSGAWAATTTTTNYGLPKPLLGPTGTADGYGTLMDSADAAIKLAIDAKGAIITAAPADGSYSGPAITCKNGEADSLVFGEIVYISNGTTATTPTVKRAKGATTVDDKMPAMGMVMATITTTSTGPVLLSGFVQNTVWSDLTVGGVAGSLWVSAATAGAFTQTKPTATGNVQMYLGCAINDAYSAGHTGQSKTIYFNPSPVWNIAP